MSANNIQVAIKSRPLLKREREQRLSSNWKVVNNSIQLIESQNEPFFFDHIFDEDETNQTIFNTLAKPIVDAALKGFNGTIFAYGQTASGKTYTMLGDEKNHGVMVLAAKEIFNEIEQATHRAFLLRIGYIEIYNEKIYDLLNQNNADLKIHETVTGDVGVNCTEIIITSEEEMMEYMRQGSKHRRCGETNMNERSSRSHAIFRIIIESRGIDKTSDDGSVQISILNLVDLAGSERAVQTGATGSRLKEGGHINKSLMFLSRVIKELSENDSCKFISYRDSKLTRILQASLGGNALTAIICTINPTAIEETHSTLSFAMRAKSIKNRPEVNEVLSDAAMMKRLEKEIARLQSELEVEKSKNSKIKIVQLERQIKDEHLKIISSQSLGPAKTAYNNRRRRTWCPSTSVDDTIPEETKAATQNSKQLFPPSKQDTGPMRGMFLTPLITLRGSAEPTRSISPASIEEFTPIEEASFLQSPNRHYASPRSSDLFKTPRASNPTQKSPVNLTPKKDIVNSYKMLEKELQELRDFTNLEKKFQVEHDGYDAIRHQLEEAQKLILDYQRERIEYVSVNDELIEANSKLESAEFRCAQLETRVTDLEADNQQLQSRIVELEAMNSKLEVENRNAVSLEFELQQLKNKWKLREAELLAVIGEREKLTTKFERSQEKLKLQFDELSTEHAKLQDEYNQISNEIMDYVQENEILKEKVMKFEETEKNTHQRNELNESRKRWELENLALQEEANKSHKEKDDLLLVVSALTQSLHEKTEECTLLKSERRSEMAKEGENRIEEFLKSLADVSSIELMVGSERKTFTGTFEHSKNIQLLITDIEKVLSDSDAILMKGQVEKLHFELKESSLTSPKHITDNKVVDLESKIAELNEHIQHLTQVVVVGLEEENRKLTSEREVLLKELEQVRANLSKLELENHELLMKSEQLHELSGRLSCAQEKCTKLEESNEQIMRDLNVESQRVDNLKREMEKQSESAQNEISRLTEQLTESLVKLATLQAEHDSLIMKYELEENKSRELERTIQNNENLLTLLRSTEDECKSLKGEASSLGDTIMKLEQEREQLQTENEKLIKELENQKVVEETIRILQQEREELRAENVRLGEKLEMNAEGSEDLRKIHELQIENGIQNEKLRKLEEEKENLLSDLARTTSVESQLEAQKTELVKSIESIQKLESEKAQLQVEIEKLSSSLEVDQQTLHKLENEKSQLQLKNEELVKSLDDIQKSQLQNANEQFAMRLENIRKLESEKIELQSRVQELLAAVESERKIVESLESVKAEAESQNEKLSCDLKTGQETISRLQSEMSGLQCKYETFSCDIQHLESEKLQLRGDFENLSNDMQKLQAEKAQFKSEHEKVLRELTIRDDIVRKLESEKVQMQSEIENLLASLSKEQDKLQQIETELAQRVDQNEELSKLLEITRRIESEKALMQSENEKLSSSLASFESEKAELQHKNAELLSTLELVKNAKQHVEVEKTQLEEQNKDFSSSLESLKQTIQTIEFEKSSLVGVQQTLELEKAQLQVRNEELSSLLENEQQTVRKLESEKGIIMKDLESQKANDESVRKFREEIQHLQVENEKLSKNLLNQKLAEKASQAEVSQLKSQIEQLKQVSASIEMELNQCQTLNADLQNALSAMNSSYEALIKKSQKFENDVPSYEGKIRSLEAENQNFKHHIKELESKLATLVQENSSLRDQLNQFGITHRPKVEQLQKQIDELQQTNSVLLEKVSKSTESSMRRDKMIETLRVEINQLKAKNQDLIGELGVAQKTTQKDRKSRRQSTHDERRRQSMWELTRDVETMTEPTDQSCNCELLDKKLTEMKRQLIIRESQLNTLSSEMKCNPLKEKNEMLKKLLIEEEEKQNELRLENKKLKQIIQHKINESQKPCPKCYMLSKRMFVSSETQTEVNDEFQKLLGKYEDLKTICRKRLAKIHDLERELAEARGKENENGNKSTDDSVDSLKKNLKIMKKKYEEAKFVCISRGEEIEKLKKKLDDCTPSQTI